MMNSNLKTTMSVVRRRYFKNFTIILKRVGLRRTIILSYRVLKTKLLRYPGDISIEASAICNLKCPMCILDESMRFIARSNRLLSFDNFKTLIDEIKGFTAFITLHYAGEPLMNKELVRMIQYAHKHNILTYFNTNGLLLNTTEKRRSILNSGLYKIHISLDGTKEETYNKYRVGGNFKGVKENVRQLVIERGSKKTPIIGLQMIATRTTINEKEEFANLAKQLGVDYAYMATLYVDQSHKTPSQEELDDLIVGKYSRYKEIKDGKAILKDKDSSTCLLLNNVYIATNGLIVHCCYDYHGEYTFGNAFEDGMKKVWRKPEYVRWRKEHAKPMRLPLCKTCTVGILEQWHYVYRDRGV